MAAVRYIVRDVDAAVSFYTKTLGFLASPQTSPNMAILTRGDLTLWVSGPGATASRPMPDGRQPEPGGWARIVLQVDDLPMIVKHLREQGAIFRNDVTAGLRGEQILVEDPSGNIIELFQRA